MQALAKFLWIAPPRHAVVYRVETQILAAFPFNLLVLSSGIIEFTMRLLATLGIFAAVAAAAVQARLGSEQQPLHDAATLGLIGTASPLQIVTIPDPSNGTVVNSTTPQYDGYAQSQQLSGYAPETGTMWVLGWNEKTSKVQALGLDVRSGQLKAQWDVPDFEGEFVGVGNAFAVLPGGKVAGVMGYTSVSPVMFGWGALNLETGKYTNVGHLNGSVYEAVLGGFTTYDPAQQCLVQTLAKKSSSGGGEILNLCMSLADGSVKQVPSASNSELFPGAFGLLTFALDHASGEFVGVVPAKNPANASQVLLKTGRQRLSTGELVISDEGLPECGEVSGGVTAYDPKQQRLYFFCLPPGANPATGISQLMTVDMSDMSGKLLSHPDTCLFCPWSLEYVRQ